MDAVQADASDTLRHSRQARSESAADTTASPMTSIHSNAPLPWSGLMPVSASIQSGHSSVSDARTAAAAAEMASAQKRGLACWFVTTDLRFAYLYGSAARPAGGLAMLLQRSLDALVIHISSAAISTSSPRSVPRPRVQPTPCVPVGKIARQARRALSSGSQADYQPPAAAQRCLHARA